MPYFRQDKKSNLLYYYRMYPTLTSLQKFWQRQPALLYAISALLGINLSLSWSYFLLFPIGILVLPLAVSFQMRTRLLLAIGIMIGSYLYGNYLFVFPDLPAEGKFGQAHLEISSVSSKTTHFGKQWIYRGTIKKFESGGSVIAKNIPYTLSIPQKETVRRPYANRSYIVTGKLKEINIGYYSLNPSKEIPWIPLEGTWSFAEWRLHIKQLVSNYIRENISQEREATFLSGIATGDFDDRSMFFEFGRFGLQHIMAISGFHFAIIASILSGLLRLFISQKIATISLILFLSSYFIFLGCASSIMRAWITISIVLCGCLMEKRGSGLNSLGVAMLAILLYDPLSCRALGFQFSFATTAAILMFYGPSDYYMQRLLIKRPLSQMIEMDTLNQHGYCVLSFLRQALALTVAVNLIALPMTLFFFQKFPLQSLLYNLFFPFMVSISMLLLILGTMCTWILQPLGEAIHALNLHYSHFMLNFIYNMPTSLDVIWRTASFPVEALIAYLCVIFIVGIFLRHYIELKHDEIEDLTFV